MKLTIMAGDRSSDRTIFRPAKLNEHGVLHHVLPMLFVVVFAVAGVGYLVATHAANANPPEIQSQMVDSNKWCLSDNNGSTAANNPVSSAICNGSAAQQWTYANGVIKNTAIGATRCLQTLSGSKAAGAKIVSTTCTGSGAQQWSHSANPAQFKYVPASVAGTVGQCLAVYGGVLGKQLHINTCNTSYKSQSWSVMTYVAPVTSGSGGGGGGGGTTASTEKIVSTLYAYPTEAPWQQVENAAPTVKYAIVNICAPDGTGSGCGKPADEKNPDWVPTIAALKAKGITPLYYISTNYGAVPLATVESEMQNAKTWYGVTDPMFDTTATTNASYYNSLYTYAVNTVGADTVMYNPGTTVPQSYIFGPKEIIQVFEGTAADFEKASFPSWMSSYPASQFSATLSVGTANTVGTDVNDAAKDHIGNFYEDDEQESPNYATLPAFWTTEVTDVTNVK